MNSAPKGLIVAAFALTFSLSAASAQSVRGTVVLSDSTTPAAGVIVEARDTRGLTVARGLSSESGAFQLDIPTAGEIELRALRVGFTPTIGARFTIAAGETATKRLVLSGLPVPLTNVQVQTKRQCRAVADTGQLISKLWVAAHTALESTQLASPDGDVVANWSVTDRSTDIAGSLVLAEQTIDQRSLSTLPFTSLPPDSLARVGYVVNQKGKNVFVAPDAAVLLSDSFARTHCFDVARPHPVHSEWIGIAFTPANDRRGFSDITGTLWLDRQTAELRRLDYEYTELAKEVLKASPGGWVEFMHLSSGPWFVSRWSIRMPRTSLYTIKDWTPGAFERDRIGGSKIVVDAVQTRTGRVKSIAQSSGTILFSNGEVSEAAAATDSASGGATICNGITSGDQYSLLFGRVLDSSNKPVADAVVTIEWHDNNRCTFSGECNFDTHKYATTANETGAWWFCGAHQGYPISVTAGIDKKFFRRLTIQIEMDQKVAKLDIPVNWP